MWQTINLEKAWLGSWFQTFQKWVVSPHSRLLSCYCTKGNLRKKVYFNLYHILPSHHLQLKKVRAGTQDSKLEAGTKYKHGFLIHLRITSYPGPWHQSPGHLISLLAGTCLSGSMSNMGSSVSCSFLYRPRGPGQGSSSLWLNPNPGILSGPAQHLTGRLVIISG